MPSKKPDGQKITVKISDALDRRYNVVKKPNPSPSNSYKGAPIAWVTTFGFQPKAGVNVAQGKLDTMGLLKGDLEESYSIELVKDGELLVYYDGSELRDLPYIPKNAKNGDMVEANLRSGDPAVGWTR